MSLGLIQYAVNDIDAGTFATTITTALAPLAPALLTVAGVALGGIGLVRWGFPLAVSMFRRLAK